MELGLIYARARNGVIGKDNALPWHLPEDLAHFKQTTLGCPVIMGRKTWDSLPTRFRPLPGRINIVVTRQPDWRADGAVHAWTLAEAIAICGDAPRAWVTGGAEIYRLALPLAHLVVVTEIDADFEGDALAPQLGPEWREATRERHLSKTGLDYSFITYRKLPSPG
ncbi:MAG: folA [Ramlibacter sp.]|jgi:dihydrofolate reductase|uniref:dihydrofolate reductase n=1 Tax=Ramlibacter sp. TaxID=1917967 RepID=UPI002623B594|nr:dihydrofolate reductase [Ramlibacter sp.]MDB5751333.1 folA [Ramlibacter sp.]